MRFVDFVPILSTTDCTSEPNKVQNPPRCITKYGSALYNIGMDEVMAHYACTFENSNLHFHFQL